MERSSFKLIFLCPSNALSSNFLASLMACMPESLTTEKSGSLFSPIRLFWLLLFFKAGYKFFGAFSRVKQRNLGIICQFVSRKFFNEFIVVYSGMCRIHSLVIYKCFHEYCHRVVGSIYKICFHNIVIMQGLLIHLALHCILSGIDYKCRCKRVFGVFFVEFFIEGKQGLYLFFVQRSFR